MSAPTSIRLHLGQLCPAGRPLFKPLLLALSFIGGQEGNVGAAMKVLSPAQCCCRVGVNRISFLLESLADLDNSFKARGTRLLVLKGNPLELMPKLFKVCFPSWLCRVDLQCTSLRNTDRSRFCQLCLTSAVSQACQGP